MMYPNSELVKFIKATKKKGFEDYQIKEPLIKHGWNSKEVDNAFFILRKAEAKTSNKPKNKVTIYLKKDIQEIIERRAKKNMLTLPEQIEDILRRSCINMKKSGARPEKLDDTLIGIFSRSRRGRR